MKRLMKLLGCAALCVCLLANATAVLGDDEDPLSDVTVSFQENTDPTDPVDPDNPGNPDPELPGTGMEGPLSIDYVPELDFGSGLKVSGATQHYSVADRKPFIQITDNRGAATGWTVRASLSGFTREVVVNGDPTEEPSLPGSEITLTGAEAVSANSTLKKPNAVQNVVLPSDGAEVLVIQGVDQAAGASEYGPGTGTWVNRWYPTGNETDGRNESIQLTVYGGTATLGEHWATITWILSEAP